MVYVHGEIFRDMLSFIEGGVHPLGIYMNQSFCVIQYLVPLTVVDVCICLGLGVGGIELEFDEILYGLGGSLFNGKAIIIKYVIKRMKCIISSGEDVNNICVCIYEFDLQYFIF